MKELADLAGVSRRTLHYYDQIDLLKPSKTTEKGYRLYDDQSLFRLQQILFYREIGIELIEIKAVLDDPNFDLIEALHAHRARLTVEMGRLGRLIHTVDETLKHLNGKVDMAKKKIFEGFNKDRAQEAVDQWGETAQESIQLWNSYGPEQQQAIMDEGNAIYAEIVENMERGPDSPEIRALLVRWHQHLRYFYEPTIEVLEGLGNLYAEHPDFNAKFSALHSDLPDFLKASISIYVDELETEWLKRELGILEESE
ncbi:MAG: MerR family transcriptional regulator [Chloroflexota bacterium]